MLPLMQASAQGAWVQCRQRSGQGVPPARIIESLRGGFDPACDIPRVVDPQRLELAGQDAGEAHQAALRAKNEDPFHDPIPSSSSSLSFSGVGQPVVRSHPLAV